MPSLGHNKPVYQDFFGTCGNDEGIESQQKLFTGYKQSVLFSMSIQDSLEMVRLSLWTNSFFIANDERVKGQS